MFSRILLFLLCLPLFLQAEQVSPAEAKTQENPNPDFTKHQLFQPDSPDLTNVYSEGFESFWKTIFRAKTFTDRSTIDAVLSTEIYGKIDWSFFDSFSIHTQGLIVGRNGFTQSIYDRADRKNGLYLLEGYFNLNLASFFSIRMGSIKQDFLEAPLLITDKTFPSIIQKVSFSLAENISTDFIFQQAIPDNATEFVRRETQIVHWTPLFFTVSHFINIDSIFQKASFKTKSTAFLFTNLSPAVAELGRIRGNTVDYQRSDSQFKYSFAGFHINAHLQFPLSAHYIALVGGDFLYNTSAPKSFDKGERAYGALFYNYRDFVEIKLTGEYFANQSDSSVGYYNSEIYGHNNRVGGLARFEAHLYNSGITLGASYVYSQPINQSRSSVGVSSSFDIFLKTNYVAL